MTAAPLVTLIAAVAADGCIGIGGRLPFRLESDLRRFRRLTLGKPVIMGRKTWESLPRRPLPGRPNIVVSRSMAQAAGATVARSPAEAMAAACAHGAPEVMVIGGAGIYAGFLPLADILEITHVDGAVPGGDAFFPAFGSDPSWLLLREEAAPRSGEASGGPAAVFRTYLRRRRPGQDRKPPEPQATRAASPEAVNATMELPMTPATIPVELKVLDPALLEFGLPRPATGQDAAADLVALGVFAKTAANKPDLTRPPRPIADALVLAPGEMQYISAGFAIHIGDPGFAAHIIPRSSSAALGLALGNSHGLIDPGYNGPILVALLNRNVPQPAQGADRAPDEGHVTIVRGERIAQMYFAPVIRPEWTVVEEFSRATARGAGGFGSTGRS